MNTSQNPKQYTLGTGHTANPYDGCGVQLDVVRGEAVITDQISGVGATVGHMALTASTVR